MLIPDLYALYTQHFLVDTDTRSIRKNTLFFALKGDNFNGNQFAAEALKKGASYSIVDEPAFATDNRILLVPNVLEALQALATYHRTQLDIPVIGLTGSNGKTTTKELTQAVLSTQYNVSATLGNLNNHIGVPLTLLAMTPKTEIGIVEMGANHPKEIAFLCTIAQPDYGYITNFGKAHLEGFGSLEGVVAAKSELYDYLKVHQKTAFVNPDDPIQREKSIGIAQVLFDVENLHFLDANPLVKISYHTASIQSNLIGDYNFSNLAAAITIGNYFKVSNANIQKSLEEYVASNNRSQVVKTKSNTVLLDAYNANPTSVKAALENFKALETPNKLLILGDMFELGESSAAEHQEIVALAQEFGFSKGYLIGKQYAQTNTTFQKFETFEAFTGFLNNNPIQEHTILIKGSRGMALERVQEWL